jgi:hypothetical protein
MAAQGVPPHALLPRAPSPRPAPPPVVTGVELGLGHRVYDHGSHIRRYHYLSPPMILAVPGLILVSKHEMVHQARTAVDQR